MGFVVAGLLLSALKLAGITIVAKWPWWIVLAPFAMAAIWWTIADTLGITQRDVMKREQERAERRRQERFEALGMKPTVRRGGKADGSSPAGRR